MAKTIWMDRLIDVRRKGDVVCFVLQSDGEPVHVRCERHEGLAAIKLAAGRWCELDREERRASVLPFRKR